MQITLQFLFRLNSHELIKVQKCSLDGSMDIW